MFKSIISGIAIVGVLGAVGCRKQAEDTTAVNPNSTTYSTTGGVGVSGTAIDSTATGVNTRNAINTSPNATTSKNTNSMGTQQRATSDDSVLPPVSDTGSGSVKERQNRPH